MINLYLNLNHLQECTTIWSIAGHVLLVCVLLLSSIYRPVVPQMPVLSVKLQTLVPEGPKPTLRPKTVSAPQPKAQALPKKPQVLQKKQMPLKVSQVKKKVEPRPIVKSQTLPKVPLISAQEWQIAQQKSLSQEWDELLVSRQQEISEHVKAHVQKFWQLPDISQSWQATLRVKANQRGQVQSVVVTSSSGHRLFDASCIEAVKAASPLPVGEDDTVAKMFEDFDLVMNPQQVHS